MGDDDSSNRPSRARLLPVKEKKPKSFAALIKEAALAESAKGGMLLPRIPPRKRVRPKRVRPSPDGQPPGASRAGGYPSGWRGCASAQARLDWQWRECAWLVQTQADSQTASQGAHAHARPAGAGLVEAACRSLCAG